MAGFPLNSFLDAGRQLGYADEYLKRISAQVRSLEPAGLPVILSLRHLAAHVGQPYGSLRSVVTRAKDPYRVFSIRKRSGGWRRIAVPEPSLAITQRWIHERILLSQAALQKIHRATAAFTPGASALKNAKRHVGARWLIKVDVKDFFESLSERQVYRVFRSLGYRALVAFELTRLTTRVVPGSVVKRYRNRRWRIAQSKYPQLNNERVGHIPQGAPTSPMLANLVVEHLDTKLESLASSFGCVYSRYADDIAFSAERLTRSSAKSLIRATQAFLGEMGFRVNERKVVIAPPGTRKMVTGLVVNDSTPRLRRKLKDGIRAQLYYAKKFGLQAHCARIEVVNIATYLRRLKGLIQYAAYIEPRFGKRMAGEFQEILTRNPLLTGLITLNEKSVATSGNMPHGPV